MAWSTPSRERRVLKAGHSSIAVTLPKPWAEAMNLHPGDLIVFDQNDDGTLYLKPAPTAGTGGAAQPYLVQVHSFEAPGILERLIVGAYRVGHDAIEIRTEVAFTPERVEELHAAARGLLGVSVVAQEPNRVLLQNFIDPSKYGLPQLVQRMKMILVAFLDEIEEVLQRHVRSRRLTTLDEEGSKVLALLVRQLFLASRDWSLARRIGSPDPRHLLEWRVVVYSLQDLARLFREAAAQLNGGAVSAPGPADSLVEFVPEVKAYLKEVMDALIHPELERACEVHQGSVRLGEAALRATDRLKGPARRNGAFSASLALQRSTRCLSLLSEVAIDRAVSAGTESILADAA